MDGVGGDWRGGGYWKKVNLFLFFYSEGMFTFKMDIVLRCIFFFFIFPLCLPLLVGYGMYVLPALYHYILSPQYSSWVTCAFLRRDSFLCFFFFFSIIL